MSCAKCANIVERFDIPHVIRKCSECGREMHIVEPGENGKGIKVKAGDKFVFPEGSLSLSLNPLKSTGHLYKGGIDFLARSLFLGRFYPTKESLATGLTELEEYVDKILYNYEPLKGLDINNPEDGEKIFEIIKSNDLTREYWAFMTGQYLAMARESRKNNDHIEEMWNIARAERCRSMMVFKEGIEDVVWMGQSVKRILELINIWDTNKQNDDEAFWQDVFSENTYSLSQVFAVPVVFIQNKAYVGGAKLDGKESRFVDYLLSVESSRESILVEIKTPSTKLSSGTYRDLPAPSKYLSGSVVQVLNYRTELISNLGALVKGSEIKINAINPKCVLIIGNASQQFTTDNERKCFELYRANMKDVEIITFDELFRKIEILIELFGLKRT